MADPADPARADPAPGDGTYTIFVRGFAATVALAGEADDRRRPVQIDVRLTVAHPGAGFPDDIAAVTSYEDVVLDLRALCGGGAVPGAAALAERAAALCVARPAVEAATVVVVIEGAGRAEVTRVRAATGALNE